MALPDLQHPWLCLFLSPARPSPGSATPWRRDNCCGSQRVISAPVRLILQKASRAVLPANLVPAGCWHGHGTPRAREQLGKAIRLGTGLCPWGPWARLKQLGCSPCPAVRGVGVNSHPK